MAPGHTGMIAARFPLFFLGAALLLMALYNSLPPAVIEDLVVRYFAVVPGGVVLDGLFPAFGVNTQGTRILSSVANLNVLKGCEGTEALLLLYAGVVASWRPAKATLAGLLGGTALVFVLNQLRIVVLYFVVVYHKPYFELVHGFLAPLLMVAVVGLYFFLWREGFRLPRQRSA